MDGITLDVNNMAVIGSDPANMAKYQKTLIKEWREYRHLTQEALAERVGCSVATISRLENGKQPYYQPLMEALADALGCEVVDLIATPPQAPKSELEIYFKNLSPEKREQAIRILRALDGEAA